MGQVSQVGRPCILGSSVSEDPDHPSHAPKKERKSSTIAHRSAIGIAGIAGIATKIAGRLTSDLILPVVLPTISSIRFIKDLLQLVNPKSIQRLRKNGPEKMSRPWGRPADTMHRCW
jgi:hypothetical protein